MKKSKTRIALAIVLFIVLLLFVLNTILIPVGIRKKLDGLIIGGLNVKVEKVHAGFFNQSLKLSGIQVNDSLGNFSANINQIKCSGINIGSFILYNRFKAHSLIVKSPEISIRKDLKPDTTAKSAKKPKNEFKVLIKNLSSKTVHSPIWIIQSKMTVYFLYA